MNSIIEVFNAIVSASLEPEKDMNNKSFYDSFKNENSTKDICLSIYNHFKDYQQIHPTKGKELIYMPSYLLREKKVDVKSLCIIYSKILHHCNIIHSFRLKKLDEMNYYMYVLAIDENGDPIHLHTDFKIKFNSSDCEFVWL